MRYSFSDLREVDDFLRYHYRTRISSYNKNDSHDIAKILALKPSNLTLFYQYFVFNLQSVPITTV